KVGPSWPCQRLQTEPGGCLADVDRLTPPSADGCARVGRKTIYATRSHRDRTIWHETADFRPAVRATSCESGARYHINQPTPTLLQKGLLDPPRRDRSQTATAGGCGAKAPAATHPPSTLFP